MKDKRTDKDRRRCKGRRLQHDGAPEGIERRSGKDRSSGQERRQDPPGR